MPSSYLKYFHTDMFKNAKYCKRYLTYSCTPDDLSITANREYQFGYCEGKIKKIPNIIIHFISQPITYLLQYFVCIQHILQQAWCTNEGMKITLIFQVQNYIFHSQNVESVSGLDTKKNPKEKCHDLKGHKTMKILYLLE